MAVDLKYGKLIKSLKPTLESSLDPVAILNSYQQIIYANLAMKNFLQLRARDLDAMPVFCNLVKLAACKDSCCIQQLMKSGKSVRLDEQPAQRGDEKLRILIKVVPVWEQGAAKYEDPTGAIITLRDSTAELILQAKYHKLKAVMDEKDAQVRELQGRVEEMQLILKKARALA